MNQPFAQPTLQPIHADDSDYASLLALAIAPAEAELGKSVRVDVERFDRLGHWAFVLGKLEEPGGGRIDYSNTPYAASAAAGSKSDVFVALLRQHDDSWTTVAHATGPSDVAWLPWPEEHGAPRALLGF